MYQTINEHDFIRAFEAIRPENFSRRALQELFSWYEGMEEETGEQMELDPIAICCDWSEYSGNELIREYPDYVDCDDDGDIIVEELEDETTVIVVDHYESEPTYLVLSF